MAKNLPAKQETWVSSLGQEDSVEKEVAINSGILAWRIPWTEEPGGLSPWDNRVSHDLTHQAAAATLIDLKDRIYSRELSWHQKLPNCLPSHWQHGRILVPAYPHQHLVLSVFIFFF